MSLFYTWQEDDQALMDMSFPGEVERRLLGDDPKVHLAMFWLCCELGQPFMMPAIHLERTTRLSGYLTHWVIDTIKSMTKFFVSKECKPRFKGLLSLMIFQSILLVNKGERSNPPSVLQARALYDEFMPVINAHIGTGDFMARNTSHQVLSAINGEPMRPWNVVALVTIRSISVITDVVSGAGRIKISTDGRGLFWIETVGGNHPIYCFSSEHVEPVEFTHVPRLELRFKSGNQSVWKDLTLILTRVWEDDVYGTYDWTRYIESDSS